MKIARIRLITSLMILLILGSSCSPASPTPEPPEELLESTSAPPARPAERTVFPTEELFHGTISIRHSWDESQLPTLATIIKSFQTYYPDVLFEVLYVPADVLLDRFINETNEGMGPTILLGPAEWGPALRQSGMVADLSSEFSDKTLQMINPAALGAARVKGALVGLPYSISGVVLYRNKDIVTIHADTFEEMVSLAQTSTQGRTIGAYLERSFFYSGAHLDGLGGRLIDENNLPGFNNDRGIAWLQLLKDLEQAGPTNYFSDDDLERFKLGEVGWIIDGTWNLDKIVQALGAERLAVDPWPAYEDGRLSGYVRAENVYLSSKTGDPEKRAALKFIQFLISQEAQTWIADIGRIPSGQHVNLSDPAYGAIISQVIEALRGGTTYPVAAEMPVYNLNLEIALRAYFEQGLPAEQALQNAQDAILLELAKSTPTAPP